MAKAKKPSSAPVQETLVIASRVKELIKEQGMRSDADFIDALSRKVADKVLKAIERAKSHNVSTVRARDL